MRQKHFEMHTVLSSAYIQLPIYTSRFIKLQATKPRSEMDPFIQVKVKVTLEQAMKAQRGKQRYSSTLSLTSALEGMSGQRHAPATLSPGKRHVTHFTGDQVGSRSGRVRKISSPPGFHPRSVQPVASRYTDGAIAADDSSFYARWNFCLCFGMKSTLYYLYYQ